MDNSSNSTAFASPPSSIGIANPALAPVGVTLLLLLLGSVVAYVFARKRHSVGVMFDETAPASGDEDEIDEDEYFGVNEETIKSFQKFAYSQIPELISDSSVGSCTICLQDYKEEDVVRVLPVCNHMFHQGCVDPWLNRHSTCPICRISLLRSTCFYRFN